jgi:hypothetical protein
MDKYMIADGGIQQNTDSDFPVQLCFDAIHENVPHIPYNPFAVAGYINGANRSYIWTIEDWQRFPNAGRLRINVTGNPAEGGNVLDVERFDATSADIPHWYDERHKAGERVLLVYCNRSNLTAVNHFIGNRPCWRWVATLDGTMTYDNRAMIQFSSSRLSGGPYDVSVIWSPQLARIIQTLR